MPILQMVKVIYREQLRYAIFNKELHEVFLLGVSFLQALFPA